MIELIYCFRNIKNSFKYDTFIAVAVIISQLAAIIGILLSIGFISDTVIQRKAADRSQRHFAYYFYSDESLSPENSSDILLMPKYYDIENRISELLKYTDNELEFLYLSGVCQDDDMAFSVGTYFGNSSDDNEYKLYSNVSNSNEPIVIVNSAFMDEQGFLCKKNDIIKIGDTDFKVEDISAKMTNSYFIPNKFIPEECKIDHIQLMLKEQPTELRAQEISNKFIELFGKPMAFDSPEIKDLVNEQTGNMYIVVSIIIMIIVSLNISLYYKYIFDRRIRQNGIFRVCGARPFSVFLIHLYEMVIENLFSLLVSYFIFVLSVKKLRTLYQGFAIYDRLSTIIIIIISYIIVSFFISVMISFPYSRMTPKESIIDPGA